MEMHPWRCFCKRYASQWGRGVCGRSRLRSALTGCIQLPQPGQDSGGLLSVARSIKQFVLFARRPSFNSEIEMWAIAQRNGRPAEHRWRPLFNAAKFG